VLKRLNEKKGVFTLQLAKKWAKGEVEHENQSKKKSRSKRKTNKSRSRRSRNVLRGGYTDKGINPETGGFMQYLFSLPTKVAATVDRSGSMIASAFTTK
jgi:hypothetical protein